VWFAPLLLAALCLFHVAANLWWLTADNHVIRVDEETHMEYAREYYSVFALRDFEDPFEQLIALGNIRPKTLAHPPLLHIMGGALLAVFGYAVDTMALANTFTLLFAILGVYLLARRMLAPPEAVFAAAVFSFAPMIFAGSRFFMTDYVSMALVVWAMYALLQSRGFLCTNWVTVFALCNGLAFLSRSVTFLYYLVPLAVVILYGVLQCVRGPEGWRIDWPLVRKLIAHGVITVMVTLGVALPWYVRHMENIYDYWVGARSSVTGSPIALEAAVHRDDTPAPPAALPEPRQVPPSESDPETYVSNETVVDHDERGPAVQARPPAATPLGRLVDRILYPWNPWVAYPVHVINNALFLPLTALSVLGAALAWTRGRFRRFDTLILLLWVLGAWFLLQALLRWSTPRYALQVLPAMLLFASLAVLVIPWRRVRLAAGTAVLLLLLVQFVNMTFVTLGPLARVELPVVLSKDIQEKYGDPGLAVMKNMISGSNAFRRMSVPNQKNYKHEIFGALVKAETSGPPRAGEFADYARLNMLGMEFDEQHYWPEPNPFVTSHAASLPRPARKLRSTVLAYRFRHVEPYLKDVDYLVYRATSQRQEEYWIKSAEAHEFSLIHQYFEPQIGADPEYWYGVMAKGGGQALDLSTTEAVDALDFHALHQLVSTPAFARAPEASQRRARERYTTLLQAFTPHKMTDQISLLNADITPLGDGVVRMRYVFRVDQLIERDVGIYLIGWIPEWDYGLLSEEKRARGEYFFDWHLLPAPPTSTWEPGSIQVVYQDITPNPIQHQLLVGLEAPGGEVIGQGIQLGVTDFATLQAP
jgi:4-amino-4-deoxy-L-arabinose transferase-like glycosyltransferase